MQTIATAFPKLIFCLMMPLVLFNCARTVPISERIYGNGVIKEYEVGSYLIENEELVFDKQRAPTSLKLFDKAAQKKLIAIIIAFKKSVFFMAEKSDIEAIVWDVDNDNVRFQLHNCKYFLVAEKNDNSMEIIILEQGIMAPCG